MQSDNEISRQVCARVSKGASVPAVVYRARVNGKLFWRLYFRQRYAYMSGVLLLDALNRRRFIETLHIKAGERFGSDYEVSSGLV